MVKRKKPPRKQTQVLKYLTHLNQPSIFRTSCFQFSGGLIYTFLIPGTPNSGTPFMVSFPYYSQIFRDSYGSGMGIVSVRVSHYWGSLKIPLTFTLFGFGDPELKNSKQLMLQHHQPWNESKVIAECFIRGSQESKAPGPKPKHFRYIKWRYTPI